MTHVSQEMREYVHSKETCRKILLRAFGSSPTCSKVDRKCCDVCTKTCSCGIRVHPTIHPFIAIQSDSSPKPHLVLPRQEEYLQQLLIEHADLGVQTEVEMEGSYIDRITHAQVSVLMQYCSVIFSVDNIHEFIHVSEKISRDVLALFNKVFYDCELEES